MSYLTRMEKFVGLTLAFIVLVLSCNAPKKAPEEQPSDESPVDSLLYEIKFYERSYGDCEADTVFTCTEVSVSLPVFQGESVYVEAINDSLKKHLLNDFLPDSTVIMDVDQFTEGFIEDYRSFAEEFGFSTTGWFVHLQASVLLNKLRYLSVSLNGEVYTGGAHGMNNRYFLNFDPQTGQYIALRDLIREEKQEQLADIAEEKFRKAYQLSAEKSLNQAGGFMFPDDQFVLTKNFALSDSALLFHYNSYEIAPYALGQTDIIIPYQEIREILSPLFRTEFDLNQLGEVLN